MTAARRPLSRHRILEAALGLVDRDGLAGLSMRKLGRELGVEAMSLYRYVPNKEALLDGLVELLAVEIDVPAAGAERWQDAFRRVALSYRELAHEHPHAFPLIALRPLRTPAAVARAEATVEILRGAGFDERTATVGFRAAASFANGYLLEELAGAPPHVTTGDRDADYEEALDLILGGLETRLGRA